MLLNDAYRDNGLCCDRMTVGRERFFQDWLPQQQWWYLQMQKPACMPTMMRMLTFFRRLLVVDNGRTFISCPLYDWYAMHTQAVGIDRVMIYVHASDAVLVMLFGCSVRLIKGILKLFYSLRVIVVYIRFIRVLENLQVSSRRQWKTAMRVEPRLTETKGQSHAFNKERRFLPISVYEVSDSYIFCSFAYSCFDFSEVESLLLCLKQLGEWEAVLINNRGWESNRHSHL